MKKKSKLLFFSILTIFIFSIAAFFGCKNNEQPVTAETVAGIMPDVVYEIPSEQVREGWLRMYYMGPYSGVVPGMHMWGGIDARHMGNWQTSAPGTRFDKRDDIGLWTEVELTGDAMVQFLILTNTFDGSGWGDPQKDSVGDREYSFASSTPIIYLWANDRQIYIDADKNLPQGITGGQIVDITDIDVYTLGLTGNTLDSGAFSLIDRNNNPVSITSITRTADNLYRFKTSNINAEEQQPLTLTYIPGNISATLRAGSRFIDNLYATNEDGFGATYNPNGSAAFKVWLPRADSVSVVIFDRSPNENNELGQFTMTRSAGNPAIWTRTVLPGDVGRRDLENYYYQYEIVNDGGAPQRALDPYARSMAATRSESFTADNVNWVGKGAIIGATNSIPALSGIQGFTNRLDAIIYEVHIRDFTSFWGVDGQGVSSIETGGLTSAPLTRPSSQYLGTYTAFISHLDYVQEMGYTHIQLLPVMKFRNGDELNKTLSAQPGTHISQTNYNWGYDPHNFFTPTGMYSEDARDPKLRINELKELINEIHKRGMGVILDNVYNHTADTEIWHRLIPEYYLYTNAGGGYISAYGGGKVASSRDMVCKMIVDSVKYWFEEFKIDGMRWDLMGEVDTRTVVEAYNAAQAINPHAIFVGEGWRTGHSIDDISLYPADQDHMNRMDQEVNNRAFGGPAAFSDDFRNILKSGFGSEGTPAFISGGSRSITNLFREIKAQPSNFNRNSTSVPPLNIAGNPGQVLQYIEAHDNMTVYDIIAWHTAIDNRRGSYTTEAAYLEQKEILHRRLRLGNFIILTSQGIPFMHAGQELGRTKVYGDGTTRPADKDQQVVFTVPRSITGWFIHDSYNSSDQVNQIRWSELLAGTPGNRTALYTQGLIHLRRATPSFRLRTMEEIESKITKIDFNNENTVSDFVLGYKIADGASTYYIFINADTVPRNVNPGANLTNASVLVDGRTAGTTPIPPGLREGITITNNLVTLDPLTATVIRVP